MITIKYSIRFFISKPKNQVLCRVRWNSRQFEVNLVTGVYAQDSKWDAEMQKAKRGTTHNVRSMSFTASQINDCIADFRDSVESCFSHCALSNTIPTPTELKAMVNQEIGRESESTPIAVNHRKGFLELFEVFLKKCGYEKNWDDLAKEKYQQAVAHVSSAVPNLDVDKIDVDTMYQLREWYVENGYKNRTINKQVVMLKAFLRWINQQEGYSIPSEVLNFDTNLKVVRRTVTFLHYDELMQFYKFDFSGNARLDHARDLWCFMAFTSLRYSDLADLKLAHIINNERIEKYSQKTDERIVVPLTNCAREILEKYKDEQQEDGHVFDVLTNQKLNDYVKEAAERAGINRLVNDIYFVGTKRVEEVHPFYEIIGCHDGRRTFVSCSLAMGIPAEVVMKATGHRTYATMRPYIETATETQSLEMEKWNRSQYRSQILTYIDNASEVELRYLLQHLSEFTQPI